MRACLAAAAFLVVASSIGCAGPTTQVSAKSDPTVNFKDLRTFAFAPAERMDMAGSQMADPVTRARIEAVIARELQSKGLSQVSAGSDPSVLVSYFADVYEGPVEASKQVNSWERQGRITIEVVDAVALQVLWRGDGWALAPSSQLAEKVIVDVMQRFP
jgi:hypothetical protein